MGVFLPMLPETVVTEYRDARTLRQRFVATTLAALRPGRLREYTSTATDVAWEVAPGVFLTVRYFLGAPLDQPAILFFHGNGEVVGDYDEIGPRFNEVGLHFVAAEYRGYGKSGGRPSEAGSG